MGKLAAERQAEIARLLRAQGSVRVSELSQRLGVTEETVRRDLQVMEHKGILERTYGGAVGPRGISYESPYMGRQSVRQAEKSAIARAVAQMVSDGETILLDASSTALYVARALGDKRGVTVVTNSLVIVNELADLANFTVLCTGGTLRGTSLSFVGPHAQRALRDYHVDKAIISCKGFTADRGLTDSNDLEVEIKQLMVEAANQVIAAVDSSKWGYVGFALIGPARCVDTVVTDSGVDRREADRVRRQGVEVVICEDHSR